ncbi:hypothetical protein HPB48_004208 [Haemaphysalis longicornis]|uniref:Uncharacterized protein n=1 Tax=Haemaphysalis longicornis TaxID=44386 RepID=A0A9J6GT59_HAELO|nr:hypothetical protein HPB48_004208 [Haemaphysalis longicornis]
MKEVKKFVDYLNKEFEAVKLQNAALVANNQNLVETNVVLARKVPALQQCSKANHLEIRGVPVRKGEQW